MKGKENTLRALGVALIVLAAVGLADGAYLTAEHFSGGAVVCEVGGRSFGNCGAVLESDYATVAGAPVALLGVLYYLAAFAFAAVVAGDAARARFAARALFLLTGFGVVASAWFVYLQLFTLREICIYCMVSAATTTLLFVLSGVATRLARRDSIESQLSSSVSPTSL